MIELHGWLSVRETCGNEDLLSETELEDINKRVDKLIKSADGYITEEYRNGERFIRTLFCSNHRTAETEEIISLYGKISEAAAGSYGLIYLLDDEDKDHCGEFLVYIFKRGRCGIKNDKYLSPVIPEIEDEVK